MPDFFASPSGNDANPGTSASPFRTITRAVVEALSRGGSGTIRAANGLYRARAGERFPISIPPGYSLAGEDRDLTVVRAETPATGRGIAAIESGNGVRDLTLRAGTPLPGGGGATCTSGIFINTDDARIVRVRVLPSRPLGSSRPYPPAPWPADLGDFYWAIKTGASRRALVRDCVVDWHACTIGGAATVQRCEFRDSNVVVDSGSILGCTFHGGDLGSRTALWCAVNEGVSVRGNTFRGSSYLLIDAFNTWMRVRPGRGPFVEGNVFDDCWLGINFQGNGATARIVNNDVRNFRGYAVGVGFNGTPEFRNNRFETTVARTHAIVVVDAGSRPVFEDCVFRQPPMTPGRSDGIRLYSAADFGGGGGSTGGNDFSALHDIYCNAPGEEIFLRSNTWRVPADPRAQLRTRPGTIVRL